jgi:hypothetical protein
MSRLQARVQPPWEVLLAEQLAHQVKKPQAIDDAQPSLGSLPCLSARLVLLPRQRLE